jgi:hypothetical protein
VDAVSVALASGLRVLFEPQPESAAKTRSERAQQPAWIRIERVMAASGSRLKNTGNSEAARESARIGEPLRANA